MLPILVAPLPEELLLSTLARTGELNGLGQGRRAMHDLVGDQNYTACMDLPCQLAGIAAAVFPMGGSDGPRLLLHDHTLFDFFTAFLPPLRRNHLAQQMLNGDARRLKAGLGLLAHGCGGTPYFRRCPRCDAEHRAKFGSSFWLRPHHLPGVQVCSRHRCSLSFLPSQSQLTYRSTLLLPVDDGARAKAVSPGSTTLALATLATDLLHSQGCDPSIARTCYLDAMRLLGWVRGREQVRFDRLRQAMVEHFGPIDEQFDGRAGGLTQEVLFKRLRAPFYRPHAATHPLVHLFLIGLLFGSLQNFLAAAGAAQRPPRTSAATGDRERADKPEVDRTTLEDTNRSSREIARTEGLQIHDVLEMRRRAGIAIPRRGPAPAQDEKARVRELLAQGQGCSAIAQACGLSLSSVYRLRRSFQGLAELHEFKRLEARQAQMRELWRSLQASLPALGNTELRSCAPAAYSWLYRNDREWLLAHQRPAIKSKAPARVDWAARDSELTARLSQLIRDAEVSDMPLSRSNAISAVYRATSLRTRHELLPKFTHALNALVRRRT